MTTELLDGRSAYKIFEKVKADVYRGNSHFRGTEGSVERLLLNGESAFNKHSRILKFVVRDGNDLVARFALIHDFWLADYVQVSFFEAQPGLGCLLYTSDAADE